MVHALSQGEESGKEEPVETFETLLLFRSAAELNYADISFSRNKDGGTVQRASQGNSEYAQIGVNNNPPAASSSSTRDAQQQPIKKPAPQPPSDVTQLYAQVRKK
ncbi:hypothetical protein EYF80_000528 [Liparis tanakae]|uniref:Uncharacterized protein n=1 Tax=Liparis tanakae TaxID=230148 RepID=A0A4Z2JGB6_9TELE|nr:hypothetical protein EYF80_000528 [Liparis tanakae]